VGEVRKKGVTGLDQKSAEKVAMGAVIGAAIGTAAKFIPGVVPALAVIGVATAAKERCDTGEECGKAVAEETGKGIGQLAACFGMMKAGGMVGTLGGPVGAVGGMFAGEQLSPPFL